MRWACVVLLAGCGRIAFDPYGLVDDDAATADADLSSLAPCAPVGGDTIALYTFDEADLGADATGAHPAIERPPLTPVPGACGTAIDFGTDGHLLVAASPDFALATGSIDVYVRTSVTATGIDRSFFGRDAMDQVLPGHLLVGIAAGGDLVARLQDEQQHHYRCAPPLALDTWVRIGVSFGGTDAQGFRLWVDGVEATQATSVYGGAGVTCGQPIGLGIDGNANTFVMGADNGRGIEGDPDPMLQQYFRNGDLDHLHVRSTWRDFGAL